MNEENIDEVNWVEYFDDNTNQPYFVNKLTSQSQFELPIEYEEWKQNEIEKYLKLTNWRRRKDEKKNAYFYFNKLTNKTQWEIPEEILEFIEFLKNTNSDRTNWDTNENEGENEENEGENEEEEERNEIENFQLEREFNNEITEENEMEENYEYSSFPISSDFSDSTNEENEKFEKFEKEEIKELEFLETKLSAKDAIMEPTINQTIHKYLRVVPDATPASIVNKLSVGYVGYAQLTHIICGWISIATSNESKKSNFDEDAFIAKEMCALIKRKFNKVLKHSFLSINLLLLLFFNILQYSN